MKTSEILYKKGNKIICYITYSSNKYSVCTGKPSDSHCLSWNYDNLESAKITATEYFTNYTNMLY